MRSRKVEATGGALPVQTSVLLVFADEVEKQEVELERERLGLDIGKAEKGGESKRKSSSGVIWL